MKVAEDRLLSLLVAEMRDCAIFMLDVDGTVRTWNLGAERFKGYQADEIIGRHFTVFYPPEEVAAGKADLLLEVAKAQGRAEDQGWRVRKDGTRFWAEVVITAIRDDAGTLRGFGKVTRDMTERREHDRRLHEAEAQFRQSFDEAAIGMVTFGLDECFLSVNDAFAEIVGVPRESLVGRSRQTVIFPEDLAPAAATIAALMAGERRTVTRDARFIHADGCTVWAIVNTTLVRDADGAPHHFVAQVQDTTERHAQELALRANEARLVAIIEHTPAAIVLRDLEGRYELVNPPVADALGVGAEELIGKSPEDLYPPEIVNRLRAQDQEVLRTRRPVAESFLVPQRDGSVRVYNSVEYPIIDRDGAVTGLGSFSLDVTERRLAEGRLRDLAAIVDSTDDAVFGVTGGEITSWNAAAERMFGYSAQEAIGQHINLTYPEGYDDEYDMIAERLIAEERVDLETSRRRKDGQVITVSLTISALRDDSGRIVGAGTIARDITEKTLMLERTRLAEELYRTTLDQAPIGIALTGLDGRWLQVNQALCEMLGYSEEDLTGQAFMAVTHPGDREESRARLDDLVTGATPRADFEKRYFRADGTELWAQVSASPARDRTGQVTHFVTQIQDVSHRRAAEARLRTHAAEQEALRALATLVASEAEPRAVHAAAAQRVAEVLNADFGGVACLEGTDQARLVGSWSAPGQPLAPVGAMVDREGPTAAAASLRTGLPADIPRYDEMVHEMAIPVRSALAAPIVVNGAVWGAITVGWTREAAAESGALELIGRVADLVSLAVSGADAREQLSRLASTDELTGLYNQRTFIDRLEHEVLRARRHNRQVSLIILDVDHFKAVNDTHGHEAGNKALIEFSRRLLAIRRRGETLARVGGEEFAWILPATSGDQAREAAERARKTICDVPFEGIGPVTASLGICSIDDADDAAELFRHADMALYWSKSNGRNLSTRYHLDEITLVTSEQQTSKLQRERAKAAIWALASAVDAKDKATQRHSERVAAIATLLAVEAGWSEDRVVRLRESAMVHDVGKIAIPDSVLLKAGPLSDAEYELVKGHALVGAQMVGDLLDAEQVRWIRHHHERVDGGGYPDGLAGAQIPEGACILAVADAWDAMTVPRSYGDALTLEDAILEVKRSSGSQFCPDVVSLLLKAHQRGDLK